MALFEWKPEYSVSVTRFDNDHKKLFSLLNELNDAMSEKRGRLVIIGTLQELGNYTRRHFAVEEAAMRKAKYEGLEEHIVEHRELMAKVDLYYAEYSTNPNSIPIDVLYFMRDWLEKHILITDHKYIDRLKQAGIS